MSLIILKIDQRKVQHNKNKEKKIKRNKKHFCTRLDILKDLTLYFMIRLCHTNNRTKSLMVVMNENQIKENDITLKLLISTTIHKSFLIRPNLKAQ